MYIHSKIHNRFNLPLKELSKYFGGFTSSQTETTVSSQTDDKREDQGLDQ